MVTGDQARKLIASLFDLGKTIDPDDLSVLYGWIHSAYVALQPFPEEHRRFREDCRNSLGAPRERFQAGMAALEGALVNASQANLFPQHGPSPEYLKLLHRVVRQSTGAEGTTKSDERPA
jgi:hypothetical protein